MDGAVARWEPDEVPAERARLLAASARLADQKSPDLNRVREVNRRYRALLPDVTVACSPATGAPVTWPIDVFGLDGLFWDYESPVRRPSSTRPADWLAMTGAMRLAEPVEHPPFAVVPGPEAPFVVPRVLGGPGVRAVIAEVPVGRHTGWAVSYFGPRPEGVRLVNLWGTNTYPKYRESGGGGWDWDMPRVASYDFELAPWLDSGKLLWLDGTSLRSGSSGCPFVDLPGRRRITVIRNGEVQHLAAFAGHGAA
ncbi:hypothetical protein [Actinomadura decatromicini]|uniref:Uncharacterized protein n=1 Tax=Actinomadura decatromicini TaxID=2604572 RepID=A0A5D3FSB4_9ACTN|nr:hypothetical protein [Actinomadura decatromicini]TYK50948.1 hypothetical protein FXF68_10850 [Actinomadura decatromicini]